MAGFKRRRLAALAALAFVTVPAVALADGSATGGAVSTAMQAMPAAMFDQAVTLRGTLGDKTIQVNLRPKTEFEGGVEGDYFYFGESRKILMAGEVEGEEFALEESENGTDVSGQWNGTITADAISGTWQSADGSVSKPFVLKRMAVMENRKAATATAGKTPPRKQ